MNDLFYLNAGSSSSYRNKVIKSFGLYVRTLTFYVSKFFLTAYASHRRSKFLMARHKCVSRPIRYLLCPPFD
ncbi:hypothetical protein GALL_212970 [mine drainage metagenome]|uniref:Uncharacterized protein n=1 Tax=mine drainage metagenome TaxID=410659 RepID=A0A1J5S8W8_9ZZZZ